eukprot:SM000061S19234  [mRNA]  locus=s61:270919:275465:- [translate_table: standard]
MRPRRRRRAGGGAGGPFARPLQLACLWLLIALVGLVAYLGFLVPSPGRGAASQRQPRVLNDWTKHFYADTMLQLLDANAPFTVFAPLDDALRRVSTAFQGNSTGERTQAILSRLLGYCTVPRRLLSEDVLDVDLQEEKVVIHLLDTVLAPSAFLQSIQDIFPPGEVLEDDRTGAGLIEEKKTTKGQQGNEGDRTGEELEESSLDQDSRKRSMEEAASERAGKQPLQYHEKAKWFAKDDSALDTDDYGYEQEVVQEEARAGANGQVEVEDNIMEDFNASLGEVQELPAGNKGSLRQVNLSLIDGGFFNDGFQYLIKEPSARGGHAEQGEDEDAVDLVAGLQNNAGLGRTNIAGQNGSAGEAVHFDQGSRPSDEQARETALAVLFDQPLSDRSAQCSGHGLMDASGSCVCNLLFSGDDCQEPKTFADLTLTPHQSSLLFTRGALTSAMANVEAQKPPSTGDSPPQQDHLSEMVRQLTKSQQLELTNLLPPQDPLEGLSHRSCAVVGSSGSLLLGDYGAEIDEHDVVIRFNGAPTQGYQEQVGSKTTYRLNNVEFAGFQENNETVIHHLWLRNAKAEIRTLLLFKIAFPSTYLITFDLSFLSHIVRSLALVPSVGWVGIMFALQLCQRVDIYGFFLLPKHGFKYHYYNDIGSTKGVDENLLKEEALTAVDLANDELLFFGEPYCLLSVSNCTSCLNLTPEAISAKSDWTQQQRLANSVREKQWLSFKDWEAQQREKNYMIYAAWRQRNGQAHHPSLQASSLADLMSKYGPRVSWDSVVEANQLEELSTGQLVLYFRDNHLTVPPTRTEMLKAIMAHYCFIHRHLHRHYQHKLYYPTD